MCKLQRDVVFHSCDRKDRSRAILLLLGHVLARVVGGSLIFSATKTMHGNGERQLLPAIFPSAEKKLNASMLINAARARRELSQSEADILWHQHLTTPQCALALARMKRGQTIGQALS